MNITTWKLYVATLNPNRVLQCQIQIMCYYAKSNELDSGTKLVDLQIKWSYGRNDVN
jgi:hypothetical protein